LSETSLSVLESKKNISLLKEKISKKSSGIRWPVAFSEITKKIEDLLDISVTDIMVSAWNKYRELQKYADSKQYSPDETFLVPLAEHTIKSEHHPYMEVLVNEKTIGKINFDICISLSLKGLILKIKGGRIREILTGSCKGKGSIKCENYLLMEKKTRDIPLPGSINLGEGVPITG
jgi:hypothetical protein